MAAVAKEQGISLDRARQIKEKGLRKLRRGKARRELMQKFAIAEKSLYRGGFKNYREHDFTSTVEYIVLRRAEIQARYEEDKRQIEIMFEHGNRKCL